MVAPLTASALPGHGGICLQANYPLEDVVDAGIQTRLLSLKVHYTFNKDHDVQCLARWPHPIHVQTMMVDGGGTIGIVDLALCVQAISKCSPELLNQLEFDYNIYAHDYSEPNTPLVGQGMLSNVTDGSRLDLAHRTPAQLVTGRVTKNLMSLFSGGTTETVEVKLKLTPVSKFGRLDCTPILDCQFGNSVNNSLHSTGTVEWTAFLEANPDLLQADPLRKTSSPTMAPTSNEVSARTSTPDRSEHVGLPRPIPAQLPQLPAGDLQPKAADPTVPQPTARAGPSRPSSRASRSSRPANRTGKPRGRPRKIPFGEGSASGCEEATDGDDGPMRKKRAAVTAVSADALAGTGMTPFATDPESLRVAASTSASLRNFRPIATGSDGANPMRDLPRAPTPIPKKGPGRRPSKASKALTAASKLQMQASWNQATSPTSQPTFFDSGLPVSPSVDNDQSPPRPDLAPRPDLTPNYPEDSPVEPGSTPPVVQHTPIAQSSPLPSSPALPLMRRNDSIFANVVNEKPPADQAKVQPETRTRSAASKEQDGIPIHVFPDVDMGHWKSYNAPSPTCSPEPPPSLPPLQASLQAETMAAETESGAAVTKRPTPQLSISIDPNNHATLAMPRPCDPLRPTIEAFQKSLSPSLLPRRPNHTTDHKESETSVVGPGRIHPRLALPNPNLRPLVPACRPPVRSHSLGALSLPTVRTGELGKRSSLPSLPPSEEARQDPSKTGPIARPNSAGPFALPQIPASDPLGSSAVLALPTLPALHLYSDALFLPSDVGLPQPTSPSHRSGKNMIKKQSIKMRLESAIANGECPPFCRNCGAIETPTWRKICTREYTGAPEFAECSEKPGCITVIEITDRDANNVPRAYRVTKKTLGADENKDDWDESLLCNPCGIWLSKFKQYRPRDRWDRDFSRLGQERRKRSGNPSFSRPPTKRSRTKGDGQAADGNDTAGSADQSVAQDAQESHDQCVLADAKFASLAVVPANSQNALRVPPTLPHKAPSMPMQPRDSTRTLLPEGHRPRSNPSSSHSRSSRGTAQSPIDLEDEDLGSIRRTLFPSPRTPATPRQLGAVAVQAALPIPDIGRTKPFAIGKENALVTDADVPDLSAADYDDIDALFQSPCLRRPTTPTGSVDHAALLELFKTPTRSIVSHRPVTRSLSRSLRSERHFAPDHISLYIKSPSRTAWSSLLKKNRLSRPEPVSPSLRRSPRTNRSSSNSCTLQQISNNIRLAATGRAASQPHFLRPEDPRSGGQARRAHHHQQHEHPDGSLPDGQSPNRKKKHQHDDDGALPKDSGAGPDAGQLDHHQQQLLLCDDEAFLHQHLFGDLPELTRMAAPGSCDDAAAILTDDFTFDFLPGAPSHSAAFPDLSFLSTDTVFPSSPPKGMFDLEDLWADWPVGNGAVGDVEEAGK